VSQWLSLVPLGVMEFVFCRMLLKAIVESRAPFWNGWLKTYYVDRRRQPVAYWILVIIIGFFIPLTFWIFLSASKLL
jgi:hypothetical protein